MLFFLFLHLMICFLTNKQQFKMDVGGYALCFRPLLGREGVHFTCSIPFFLIHSPPSPNFFSHREWKFSPKKHADIVGNETYGKGFNSKTTIHVIFNIFNTFSEFFQINWIHNFRLAFIFLILIYFQNDIHLKLILMGMCKIRQRSL